MAARGIPITLIDRVSMHFQRIGSSERIFMRGCIKVPAPEMLDRGETAHSPGPNA
jgi:hypothetical protein